MLVSGQLTRKALTAFLGEQGGTIYKKTSSESPIIIGLRGSAHSLGVVESLSRYDISMNYHSISKRAVHLRSRVDVDQEKTFPIFAPSNMSAFPAEWVEYSLSRLSR